jgi:hypothetical protein
MRAADGSVRQTARNSTSTSSSPPFRIRRSRRLTRSIGESTRSGRRQWVDVPKGGTSVAVDIPVGAVVVGTGRQSCPRSVRDRGDGPLDAESLGPAALANESVPDAAYTTTSCAGATLAVATVPTVRHLAPRSRLWYPAYWSLSRSSLSITGSPSNSERLDGGAETVVA